MDTANDRAYALQGQSDRIERICFIGDSQPRPFDGRLFTDPSRPGITVMPAVRRTYYFRARRFFDGSRFDEYMTHCLWELKCIVPTRTAAAGAFTPFVFPVFPGFTETRHFVRSPWAPPIVISCGGIDMWDVEQELLGRYTVDLDPEPDFVRELPPYEAPERLSVVQLLTLIEQRCAPVFSGIRALRASGFTNICVLGLPPPQRKEWPGGKPLRLRYATRLAFNRLYETLAPESGATFIDLWGPLSKDGHRDDYYFEDIEHMNGAGCDLIMNQIYAKLDL